MPGQAPWRWMRANLFGGWVNALATVTIAVLVATVASKLAHWAVIDAVWSAPPGSSGPCRAARGVGACWALIGEKYRFMLFATYPYDEHWRPALACAIIVLLYLATALYRHRLCWLAALWGAGFAAVAILMWGGIFDLPLVGQERWGGLPVTLLLATVGIGTALPLGILLALGRRADELPLIRLVCACYIELIRAMPLVSLLFMASFVLPLFMPAGVSIDKLLRAQVAFTMFAAAYMAEVIRGGLQGVGHGQVEAATALGLGYWRTHALIVLPQALRSVIPALVNTAIAMLKNTSLVLIIGLFDFLNAAKATIVDPAWQGFGLEMFISISLVYFVICFSLSKYSQRLEGQLGQAARH
ncbi:MAG: amino acid ABC transporter permease [Alphaproteobacteria bacterium]|nr:amino acid ABC transporter permease [Alphaproteobacteria bacterium]